MKLRLLFFYFLLILISACKKDEFKVSYANGLAIVEQQGETITYEAKATNSKNFFGWILRLSTYNEIGYARRNLNFSKIPNEPGIYSLDGASGSSDSLTISTYSTKLADGDVVEDFYRVRMENGKSVGTITIHEYYERSGWVKGEFDAEFELTKEVPNNPNNQKIMHLKGEFQVRIVD